ncbi:hypothetical protein EGW08_001839 [Elysia chlorotica]|uniref:HpcH/HpaI aldolase/citrate lyase domain-containing protein n=1 Tax=Elysia chlorotica TaxID=188477 RepID=A0A433U924_ELYCH|nr:hypothetical protein EGW08_001839 [Elysia chlorotica]
MSKSHVCLRLSRAMLGNLTNKLGMLQQCTTDLQFIKRIAVQSFSTQSQVQLESPYIPRRTLMYVPGHDTKKLKKIPALKVDCAVLECEDGVAVNMKVCYFYSLCLLLYKM